ncbi:MAG: methionyl-tRNA formyltransferase [Magnetovibrio sp.]|nr:methionyl-tRNA formyltransferase [Magnetovibrio sp.]
MSLLPRLIFMGSAHFGLPTLRSLIEAGFNISCIYSQPPRVAGRGQKIQRCPVHAFAVNHGISVRTPNTLIDRAEQTNFLEMNADVVIVAAYGLMLPKKFLETPKFGCLNIHASLLPRWRGAAPIQRAIEAGDKITGISIMAMDEGLDTGGIYLKKEIPITSNITAGKLHDALAILGAELITELLGRLGTGDLIAIPQSAKGVTYAAKISREEGKIDWFGPAEYLSRKLRAFSPVPGVWCEYRGERIKLIAGGVEAYDGNAIPGTVIAKPLVVACGNDALRIEIAQRSGKKIMSSSELLRGYPIPLKTILS